MTYLADDFETHSSRVVGTGITRRLGVVILRSLRMMAACSFAVESAARGDGTTVHSAPRNQFFFFFAGWLTSTLVSIDPELVGGLGKLVGG